MKFILKIALILFFPLQLFTQSLEEDAIPFSELKETAQETRSGGHINIYHYKGELYTGSAFEKKLTHYYLYHFKKGKKHGKCTRYSKSNKKEQEWEYENGMLRTLREWYSDGDLKSDLQYSRKSQLQKATTYHKNGQLKEQIKYSRSSSNQKVKRYSLKGNISEKGKEMRVESGKKVVTKKVGKWIYYDRHGKRKKIELYDQDGEIITRKKR